MNRPLLLLFFVEYYNEVDSLFIMNFNLNFLYKDNIIKYALFRELRVKRKLTVFTKVNILNTVFVIRYEHY